MTSQSSYKKTNPATRSAVALSAAVLLMAISLLFAGIASAQTVSTRSRADTAQLATTYKAPPPPRDTFGLTVGDQGETEWSCMFNICSCDGTSDCNDMIADGCTGDYGGDYDDEGQPSGGTCTGHGSP